MMASKTRWRLGAAATLAVLLGATAALDGCSPAPPLSQKPPGWLSRPLPAPA